MSPQAYLTNRIERCIENFGNGACLMASPFGIQKPVYVSRGRVINAYRSSSMRLMLQPPTSNGTNTIIFANVWRPDSFDFDEKQIRLKEPISVKINLDNDGFSASFEPLKIFIFDENIESLKEYFTDVFLTYYISYFCADDKELTLDALKIKEWFKKNIFL